MRDWIADFVRNYGDNKLVIAVVAAVIGALLTKTVPAVWARLNSFLGWIGKRFGGRLAFLSFMQRYLEWVITEHSELKLTGVVTTEDAKKPKLEQVFVSLQVGRQRADGRVPQAETSANVFRLGRTLSWREIRELFRLQREKCLRSEKFQIEQLLARIGPIRRALWQKRNLALLRRSLFQSALDEEDQAERNKIIESFYSQFSESDVIGEFQLRMIFRQFNRIAILGVPGAGKTTLLQYLAVTHARDRVSDSKLRNRGILRTRLGSSKWRLPIFIRLSSVANLLAEIDSKDRDLSILDVLPRILPPDLQSNPVATQFFSYHLKKGHCLILLDGLDEVPTEEEFEAVVRAIRSLSVTYSSNDFIVTSRIAGWRSGVGSDFEVFYVADLNDTQVNTFIDTWYTAVERNAVIGRLEDESTAERKARERRASERAQDLKHTLKENLGIRRLASNPMLLSIIALVHRSLATLPRERSKLYSQCSKILLEQWDISRGVRVDDTKLKLEQKEAVMRRLAYAFHTGEIGDQGGGREAPESQVNNVISTILPNLGRPEADSSHLLKMLIERSGILIERQRGILSFAHHTFQEYFCAQYLAVGENRQRQEFLLEDNNLLSDWWREVILLYSGLLSDSSDFIRRIFETPAQDLCQQTVRLAALCLDEAVEVKDENVRTSVALSAAIVRTCGEFAEKPRTLTHEEISYLTNWAKSQLWYSNAAVSLAKTEAQSDPVTFNRLVTNAFTDSRSIVRRAALDCLAFTRNGSLSPLTHIADALNDSDNEVKAAAIRALEKTSANASEIQSISDRLAAVMNTDNPEVSRAFFEFLQNRAEQLPSETATQALKFLVTSNSQLSLIGTVAEPLLRRLPDNGGSFLADLLNRDLSLFLRITSKLSRVPAQLNLDSIANKIADELNSGQSAESYRILEVLRKSESEVCFHRVVLNALVTSNAEGAIQVLSHIVEISKGSSRTDQLLEVLSALAPESTLMEILARSKVNTVGPQVELTIAKALNSRNSRSRALALRALANNGQTRGISEVIGVLLGATRNGKSKVRVAALQALATVEEAAKDPQVLTVIRDALDSKNRSVRISGLQALQHCIPDAEITHELINDLTFRMKQLLNRSWSDRLITSAGSFLVYKMLYRGVGQEIWALIDALAHLGSISNSEEVFVTLLEVFKSRRSLSDIRPFQTWIEPSAMRRYVRFYEFDYHITLDATALSEDRLSLVTSNSTAPDHEMTISRAHPLEIAASHLPPKIISESLAEAYKSDAQETKILMLMLFASSRLDVDLEVAANCLVSAMKERELTVRYVALKVTQLLFGERLPAIVRAEILQKLGGEDPNIRDEAWDILTKANVDIVH